MAVDGTYNIQIDTPIGKMEEKFILQAKGNVLTGRAESPMGAHDINGKVNGNEFTWETDVNSPMGKMHLLISGKVTGNDISGSVKIGDFATSPFKGKKI